MNVYFSLVLFVLLFVLIFVLIFVLLFVLLFMIMLLRAFAFFILFRLSPFSPIRMLVVWVRVPWKYCCLLQLHLTLHLFLHNTQLANLKHTKSSRLRLRSWIFSFLNTLCIISSEKLCLKSSGMLSSIFSPLNTYSNCAKSYFKYSKQTPQSTTHESILTLRIASIFDLMERRVHLFRVYSVPIAHVLFEDAWLDGQAHHLPRWGVNLHLLHFLLQFLKHAFIIMHLNY